jgi:hypothetical protein
LLYAELVNYFSVIEARREVKKMNRKMVLAILLSLLLLLTVSLASNVQACNTKNGKDKEKLLPLCAYTAGTFQGLPPPPLFHLGFSGSGVASHIGRISLAGDEFETFDKLPPQSATQVSFTGTVTWTGKYGDTVIVKYQATAKVGEGFQGTFQIAGGTGRFADAKGNGQTWGTVEFNPQTTPGPITGTFKQWFVGTISY